MRVFTSILLFACLVMAGAAGARLYLDQARTKEGAVAPADAPGQARPVDPNRLVHLVPPLAPSPSAPISDLPVVPANIDPPTPTLEAGGATALNPKVPSDWEPAEPQFIDAADLEAPPEVLERRITNKAKAILEQIAVVSVVATTRPAENNEADEGRNDDER